MKTDRNISGRLRYSLFLSSVESTEKGRGVEGKHIFLSCLWVVGLPRSSFLFFSLPFSYKQSWQKDFGQKDRCRRIEIILFDCFSSLYLYLPFLELHPDFNSRLEVKKDLVFSFIPSSSSIPWDASSNSIPAILSKSRYKRQEGRGGWWWRGKSSLEGDTNILLVV